MATFTDHRGWTDLQPHSKFLPPNVMISAEDLATHGANQPSSDMYLEGMTRKVVYKNALGQKYYMELMLYKHPVGAANLNLLAGGVSTGASDGVSEGRFLLKVGTLAGAGAQQDAIAGALLAPYYSNTADFTDTSVNFKVGVLTPGDCIWVVRRGRLPLDASGAINSGIVLKTAANGEVAAATLIDAAVHTTHPEFLENSFSQKGKAVGIMRANSGGAAITDAEVLLSPSYLFDTV